MPNLMGGQQGSQLGGQQGAQFGGQQGGQRFADRYANLAQQSPFGGFNGLLDFAQIGSQLLGNNSFQPFLPPPVPQEAPPPVQPAAAPPTPQGLVGYIDTPWGPRRPGPSTQHMQFGGR